MSLLPRPSLTSRTTSRSVGVSDSQPLAGRLRSPRPRCAYAIASSVDRAAPSAHVGFKVILAHSISQRRHRRLVAGVIDFEADLTDALPDGVRGTEQPDRFAVTTGIPGQGAEALEGVGNALARLRVGCAYERVVRVTFGLLRITLRDRDPGARHQR